MWKVEEHPAGAKREAGAPQIRKKRCKHGRVAPRPFPPHRRNIFRGGAQLVWSSILFSEKYYPRYSQLSGCFQCICGQLPINATQNRPAVSWQLKPTFACQIGIRMVEAKGRGTYYFFYSSDSTISFEGPECCTSACAGAGA